MKWTEKIDKVGKTDIIKFSNVVADDRNWEACKLIAGREWGIFTAKSIVLSETINELTKIRGE